MKKIIVFLFVLSSFYLLKDNNEYYIDNGIRYRIIASDDSKEAQALKWQINEKILPIISKKNNSKEETEKYIQENLPLLKSIIEKYTSDYNISYGYNFFPSKKYHGIKYPEKEYLSLVITIGNSNGHNWWCFMFPPLCSLEINKDNLNDIQYDLYLKKIIKTYKK